MAVVITAVIARILLISFSALDSLAIRRHRRPLAPGATPFYTAEAPGVAGKTTNSCLFFIAKRWLPPAAARIY